MADTNDKGKIFGGWSLAQPDREGHLYLDLDTASTHAANGAREMIAEDMLQGWLIMGTQRVQVIDVSGEIPDTVLFSDVVSCLHSPASK